MTQLRDIRELDVVEDALSPLGCHVISTTIGNEGNRFLYHMTALVRPDYIDASIQYAQPMANALEKAFNKHHAHIFGFSSRLDGQLTITPFGKTSFPNIILDFDLQDTLAVVNGHDNPRYKRPKIVAISIGGERMALVNESTGEVVSQ